MDRGYVRVWRKILDHRLMKDSVKFTLFMYLLMRTAWKPCYVRMQTGKGWTTVALEPGQFIFGRRRVSEDLGIAESTVRNKVLEMAAGEDRLIDIQPDKHWSVGKIVRWDTYQGNGVDDLTGKKPRKLTGNGQAMDTSKKLEPENHTSPGSDAPAFPYPPGVGTGADVSKEKAAGKGSSEKGSETTGKKRSEKDNGSGSPPPRPAAPSSPAVAIWCAAFLACYAKPYYTHGKDKERLNRIYTQLGDADFRSRVAMYFSAPRVDFDKKPTCHPSWLFEATINNYVPAPPAETSTEAPGRTAVTADTHVE